MNTYLWNFYYLEMRTDILIFSIKKWKELNLDCNLIKGYIVFSSFFVGFTLTNALICIFPYKRYCTKKKLRLFIFGEFLLSSNDKLVRLVQSYFFLCSQLLEKKLGNFNLVQEKEKKTSRVKPYLFAKSNDRVCRKVT